MEEQIIDIGETVICDSCGTDYTNSDDIGGILFCNSAYCPACVPVLMETIRRYHEEQYINDACPSGMSFRNWVLRLRNGDNTIKIRTYNKTTGVDNSA